MKIKYLCALLLAALIYSCDDSQPASGLILSPVEIRFRQIQTVMSLPPNLCWPTLFMHVPVLHI